MWTIFQLAIRVEKKRLALFADMIGKIAQGLFFKTHLQSALLFGNIVMLFVAMQLNKTVQGLRVGDEFFFGHGGSFLILYRIIKK